MIGRTIEMLFNRVWLVVKLTLIFWLLSLSGLFVLGIGPAFKVVTSFFVEFTFEHRQMTVKEAYRRFKVDFIRSNLIFWIYFGVSLILIYNLYLSLQIQHLLFFVIDFILLFALTYVLVSFEYAVILDSQFEISLPNLLKLSIISNFISFSTYLRLLFGVIILLVLTWQFKGLILFGLTGILQIYCVGVTKDWRQQIEESIAEDN